MEVEEVQNTWKEQLQRAKSLFGKINQRAPIENIEHLLNGNATSTRDYERFCKAFEKIVAMDIFSKANLDKPEVVDFMLEFSQVYNCFVLHDLMSEDEIRKHMESMVRNVILRQGLKEKKSWIVPTENFGNVVLHPVNIKVIDSAMHEIIDHFLTTDPCEIQRAVKMNAKSRHQTQRMLMLDHENTTACAECGASMAAKIAYLVALNPHWIHFQSRLYGTEADQLRIQANRSGLAPPGKPGQAHHTAHTDADPRDLINELNGVTAWQSKTVMQNGCWCGYLGCGPEIFKLLRRSGISFPKGEKVSLWNLGTAKQITITIQNEMLRLCTVRLRGGDAMLWKRCVIHMAKPPGVLNYRTPTFVLTAHIQGTTHQTQMDRQDCFMWGLPPVAYPNAKESRPEPVRERKGVPKKGINYADKWMRRHDAHCDEDLARALGMTHNPDGSEVTIVQNATEVVKDDNGRTVRDHKGKPKRKSIGPVTRRFYKHAAILPSQVPYFLRGAAWSDLQRIVADIKPRSYARKKWAVTSQKCDDVQKTIRITLRRMRKPEKPDPAIIQEQ